MTAVRALVTAQLQSIWNRVRRESGVVGTAATIFTFTLVMVLGVLLPGFLMIGIGAGLGEALAKDPATTALGPWNAVQAVFTLLFPLLAAFRFRPALSVAEYGRFPLTRVDLVAAELPAAIFEVFPLLGIAGIVATNLGLAWRMPRMGLLVGLHAFLNVLGMLSVMVAVGSAGRLVMQRRAGILVVAVAAATLVGLLVRGGIPALRAAGPGLRWTIARLPGSQGYRGLVALRDGQAGEAGAWLSITLAGTLLLAGLAVLAYQRAFLGGAWAPTPPAREPAASRRRGAAGEVARLFFKQLSSSRSVWIPQFAPLLMTGTCLFVLRAMEGAFSRGETLPEVFLALLPRLGKLPLLAIALFLSSMLNAQIWMNQFGWDRSAIRVLLQLPIVPRDILVGKLLGLFRLTLLGWLFSGVGLSLAYRPSAQEVVGGVAAASFAFVVTTGLGQFVSLRAPRAVPLGGMAPPPPLYLSWIPAALPMFLGLALVGIWAIGEAIGPWIGPLFLCLACGGVLLAWRATLPRGERLLRASRERLLSI